MSVFASLIAEFTYNVKGFIGQFAERLRKGCSTRKLGIFHFEDIVINDMAFSDIAGLTHHLKFIGRLERKHRGKRSQIRHLGGIDMIHRVDSSRSDHIELRLVHIFNSKSPLNRINDLSLHL